MIPSNTERQQRLEAVREAAARNKGRERPRYPWLHLQSKAQRCSVLDADFLEQENEAAREVAQAANERAEGNFYSEDNIGAEDAED